MRRIKQNDNERQEAQWREDNRRADEDRADLSGAYDEDTNWPWAGGVVYAARALAEMAVGGHLAGVYERAYDAAREPYAAQLSRINWAFYDVAQAGVSMAEARRINRLIDAATRPPAEAARAHEDARLREIALRTAGAWLDAHSSRPRGKYMLAAERVNGRAA